MNTKMISTLLAVGVSAILAGCGAAADESTDQAKTEATEALPQTAAMDKAGSEMAESTDLSDPGLSTMRRRGRHSPAYAEAVASAYAVADHGGSAFAAASAFAQSVGRRGYRAPCVAVAVSTAFAIASGGGTAVAVADAVAVATC